VQRLEGESIRKQTEKRNIILMKNNRKDRFRKKQKKRKGGFIEKSVKDVLKGGISKGKVRTYLSMRKERK
jgi:hypothetical protein